MPEGLALIAVIGALALIIAMLFVIWSNGRSKVPVSVSEEGADEVYEDYHEEAEAKEGKA